MEYIVAVLCMYAEWEKEPWAPQGSYAHWTWTGLLDRQQMLLMGQLSHALPGGWLWLSTGCPQGGINGCAEWLLCGVSQNLCVPCVIIFHSPASGSRLKICLSLQTFRDPSVTLLVCVWAAESLRHQRESQARVHGICWGHDVWDLQRHLPRCAAEHAHSHDEQLLPAHCCELPPSLCAVTSPRVPHLSALQQAGPFWDAGECCPQFLPAGSWDFCSAAWIMPAEDVLLCLQCFLAGKGSWAVICPCLLLSDLADHLGKPSHSFLMFGFYLGGGCCGVFFYPISVFSCETMCQEPSPAISFSTVFPLEIRSCPSVIPESPGCKTIIWDSWVIPVQDGSELRQLGAVEPLSNWTFIWMFKTGFSTVILFCVPKSHSVPWWLNLSTDWKLKQRGSAF